MLRSIYRPIFISNFFSIKRTVSMTVMRHAEVHFDQNINQLAITDNGLRETKEKMVKICLPEVLITSPRPHCIQTIEAWAGVPFEKISCNKIILNSLSEIGKEENLSDFQSRILTTFSDISHKYESNNSYVITHGSVMRILKCVFNDNLHGWTNEKIKNLEKLELSKEQITQLKSYSNDRVFLPYGSISSN